MSGFFGKGSLFDPIGITTSKVGDPLGLNRRIQKVTEQATPFHNQINKAVAKADVFSITDAGAEAHGLQTRTIPSMASQKLLGD